MTDLMAQLHVIISYFIKAAIVGGFTVLITWFFLIIGFIKITGIGYVASGSYPTMGIAPYTPVQFIGYVFIPIFTIAFLLSLIAEKKAISNTMSRHLFQALTGSLIVALWLTALIAAEGIAWMESLTGVFVSIWAILMLWLIYYIIP